MAPIGGAFFKKVYEDDRIVRYRFTNDPPHLHRSMTVDKATAQCVPDDGRADHEFRAAASGVTRHLDKHGAYPESGSWVSH
jgi:hypothetical protein